MRNEREANIEAERYTMKRLTPLARQRFNYVPPRRPSRHWFVRVLRAIWEKT